MRNSFGTLLELTLFGESHGACVGVVLDGLPAGFEIDLDQVQAMMRRRQARGKISTQRHEPDQVRIVSGFFEGRTTGTALTILIENTNTRSGDYERTRYRLRPGHADFTAFEKYHGFQDFRGGGHFSGRLTGPIVAAGAICAQILESKGVRIATHIESLHGIKDRGFEDFAADRAFLQTADFPALSETAAAEMKTLIEETAARGDSVGAILETRIEGLPAGIGEPFFDSVESQLSRLFFSVPAVKGVSFGEGFGFERLFGSQANDPFILQEDTIITSTNRNAGINGGITNGMPVVVHTVIKPTASIFVTQHSVDYQTREETELQLKGRHDPCIAHRAAPVLDAMAAIALLDLWMVKEGEEL